MSKLYYKFLGCLGVLPRLSSFWRSRDFAVALPRLAIDLHKNVHKYFHFYYDGNKTKTAQEIFKLAMKNK